MMDQQLTPTSTVIVIDATLDRPHQSRNSHTVMNIGANVQIPSTQAGRVILKGFARLDCEILTEVELNVRSCQRSHCASQPVRSVAKLASDIL